MLGWLLRFISDDRLQQECETRDIPRYQDPVDDLETIPDEPGTVNVWRVDSEEKRRSWIDTLADYQEYNSEFDAIHVVVTDDEQLHRLRKHEIEPYLS